MPFLWMYTEHLLVEIYMYFSIRVYVLGSAGGGTLGVLGLGCVAGTLETLAGTRLSTPEFCFTTLWTKLLMACLS